MTKVLLAIDDEHLKELIIANGYDEDFIADIEREKADAQKMVEEIKREVARDCIETLNGCMYSDYEDMCNVLKKTYKIGE
jgi:hypothetical protein